MGEKLPRRECKILVRVCRLTGSSGGLAGGRSDLKRFFVAYAQIPILGNRELSFFRQIHLCGIYLQEFLFLS